MFRVFTIGKLTLFNALLLSSIVHGDVIDGEDLVDPTRPLMALTVEDDSVDLGAIYRAVVPASFDLSFVRASSSNPMAVINNQRVTIGDVIGGATVAEISRSSVTLLVNGEERKIGLYDTSVKGAVLSQ